MPKKQKVSGPSRNWYSVGIAISRTLMGVFMIYMGYILLTDSGERVYNTYLHSLRKMGIPKSKPSDASPIGVTWNDFNKLYIQAMGGCSILSGLLVILRKNAMAGIIFVFAVLFFAATKDNHWIVSDVQAIKREKKDRLENMCRDLSLFGVCLMMLSGFGQQKITDKFKPVEQ